MKKAILDLTACKSIHDLHKRIKEALAFPEHYGENPDAFWDCINRDSDVDFVTVIGSKSVSAELQETVRVILELLEENKNDWAGSSKPFFYEVLS